jgi:tRNA (guanosine-2'-O-)-methyltransferase
MPAHTGIREPRFFLGGRQFSAEEVRSILDSLVSEERKRRIEQVLDERTYRIATVVEGLVDIGNVGAVMRSAEALGYQSFHVVTGGEEFARSRRISRGAERWLDLHLWETTPDCVSHLKEEGFRIVVTHLSEHAVPIDQIDFTEKTALVFGNERDGVSDEMIGLADVSCGIPMVGFARSFNISVAAALALYQAYRDRLRRQGRHGDLTPQEKDALRSEFYLRSVRQAEGILLKAVSGLSEDSKSENSTDSSTRRDSPDYIL